MINATLCTPKPYKHLKTSNIYYLIGIAIDCTNNSSYLYHALYTKDNKLFVREWAEFQSKFEPINLSDQ